MKRLHKLFITVIATLGMLGVMTFGLPTQPQNVTPIVHADVNSSVDTSQEFQNNLKNAIGNLPFQYVNGIYELNNNQTNLNADVNVKAYVQNTIDNQQRLSTANAMLDKTIRQYQNRRDTTLPDANWKPFAMHLEAKSQDGTLEFNVAIPNTQASYTMDYATGEITLN